MPGALAAALAYLNRRERTVSEVRARLEGLDCSAEEIDAATAELVELGYLDDRRYARLYVEDRRSLDRWGAERIARNLLARGIDRELVDDALAGPGGAPVGADDELSRALELLRSRYAAPPADRRERERGFGMLVRKGYDTELCADAIRAWAAGTIPGAETDDD